MTQQTEAKKLPSLREHLSRAGRAGKGASKRRGDSEYYRNLRAKVGKNNVTLNPGR